jgi:enoyl-CoA hydratase
LEELAVDADAVVLTGQGSIFSAGVDLLRVVKEGAAYSRQFIGVLDEFCRSVYSFPKPLVVAINGHAIAGGCVVACMADRRLMAEGRGKIGVPELQVGVPFPAAPIEVMRAVVPPQFLAEVMYGGAVYDPVSALSRGLIDEVVDPTELVQRALETARQFAGLAPSAFGITKAQIRRPVLERMRAGAAAFGSSVEDVWAAPETLNAIREYVERTFKRREDQGKGE